MGKSPHLIKTPGFPGCEKPESRRGHIGPRERKRTQSIIEETPVVTTADTEVFTELEQETDEDESNITMSPRETNDIEEFSSPTSPQETDDDVTPLCTSSLSSEKNSPGLDVSSSSSSPLANGPSPAVQNRIRYLKGQIAAAQEDLAKCGTAFGQTRSEKARVFSNIITKAKEELEELQKPGAKVPSSICAPKKVEKRYDDRRRAYFASREFFQQYGNREGLRFWARALPSSKKMAP